MTKTKSMSTGGDNNNNARVASGASSAADNNDNNYRCTRCLWPCKELFRRLGGGAGRGGGGSSSSSSSSNACYYKLSVCSRCGEIVDPYCERELLLVLLDMVLLRQESYRNFLINYNFSGFNDNNSNDSTTAAAAAATKNKKKTNVVAAAMLFCSALLRGYVLWKALDDDGGDDGRREETGRRDDDNADNLLDVASLLAFVRLVAACFVGLVAMIVVGWSVQLLLIEAFVGGPKKNRQQQFERVAMALLAPTMFHFVTAVVVMVWENSATVRRIGSGLVLLYQFVALHVVTSAAAVVAAESSDETAPGGSSKTNSSRTDNDNTGSFRLFTTTAVAMIAAAVVHVYVVSVVVLPLAGNNNIHYSNYATTGVGRLLLQQCRVVGGGPVWRQKHYSNNFFPEYGEWLLCLLTGW